MSRKKKVAAQHPILLRCHRLMEAFAKSDDERDFYLDTVEGFIIYIDLDKSKEELDTLMKAFKREPDRYHMIPKFTFYESKKLMEGFVHEKVYDIDTKEKLLDIIQSKEPRENFLEFLYDHDAELEKWQQYYQERSRVLIIEWLREHHLQFVFEEDLDFTKNLTEKIKTHLFEAKVPKEVSAARKLIETKAKSYYSSDALNPRPKRGRPPKQVQKVELEPQISVDIYTAVPPEMRPFLFKPDITTPSIASFSSKYNSEQDLINNRKDNSSETQAVLDNLNEKLATLRKLSDRWFGKEEEVQTKEEALTASCIEEEEPPKPKSKSSKKAAPKKTAAKKTTTEKKKAAPKKTTTVKKKAAPKKTTTAKEKAAPKKATTKKK